MANAIPPADWGLKCANCGRPETEQSGVVAPCPCGVRAMKPTEPVREAGRVTATDIREAMDKLLCGECEMERAKVAAHCPRHAPPTLPKWNYQERAARLEVIAGELNDALAGMLAPGGGVYGTKEVQDAAYRALAMWAAHLESLREQGGR